MRRSDQSSVQWQYPNSSLSKSAKTASVNVYESRAEVQIGIELNKLATRLARHFSGSC
ncbi:hypothetical protein Cflav_PD5687 [Pedosphaera parvula Ellin514]|uniref:Uncharacterized protein n=1 Tax=Pedosphaera parvula (strain Ellin514) TaxID=320771 RepID=B9XAL7_PEDPL|nr:hypothetical protein Cflav_PD5687 [Pedosphaera parvula Ellin514]